MGGKLIGTTVSHYKIVGQLGQGGMGIVYNALDLRLDRAVALKFLPPDLIRDPESKQRFIHEAKAASALQHANICVIHDIEETDDGQAFMCMELCQGETLKVMIERGPLPVKTAVDIALQIASGLSCAHEAGITHRDIKPGNIMVTARGDVKIVDFGLAKLAGQTLLTRTGTTLGTVAYMSPEQARSESVDRRTDIWSLGAILYQMLTGRPPFPGEYAPAVLYAIINTEPEPVTGLRSGIPLELERVVAKALTKNPEERYQHTDELAADLKAVVRRLEAVGTGQKPAVSPRKPVHWAYYSVLPVVVLLVALGYFLLQSGEAPIDSLAVLPLNNFSGDPKQEYFSDGMTESLIAELQKIKALRVISRTSVMGYKQTDKKLPEIAKELNVRAVIEGSVVRSGDNVRITVQLIGTSPERHLWANSFDRKAEDVLALQSDVAQAIAKEIRVAVSPDEQRRIASSRQVNPGAYEAYLRALAYANRFTEEGFTKAIEFLNLAIARDSNYAAAYAGLGLVYNALVAYGYGWIAPREGWPKAKELALKALQIDETVSEAHTVLADVKFYFEWDLKTAEKEYRRALELNPGSAYAHYLYSDFLAYTGRFPEAFAEGARASELDPLSLEFKRGIANCYYLARDFDRATSLLGEILAVEPRFAFAHRVLAWTYCAKGMYPEAIASAQEYVRLQPDDIQGRELLCQVYAVAGDRTRAESLLRSVLSASDKKYLSRTWLARVYGLLGQPDRAFEWLDRAYKEKDIDLVVLRVDPQFDVLRSDRRFAAVLKKIGLEF